MSALERAVAAHADALAARTPEARYAAKLARTRALAALPSAWHVRQAWLRIDRLTAEHRARLAAALGAPAREVA